MPVIPVVAGRFAYPEQMADGLTLTYTSDEHTRTVTAHLDGHQVGRLTWYILNRTIAQVIVDPAYQRRGIGVALYEYSISDAVPELERPREPYEDEPRSISGEALYWAGRRSRDQRDGQTPGVRRPRIIRGTNTPL